MVDNEIIKNAVVIPKDKKYFISLADGLKVPCKFDDEGRFKATYTPSGNLIGDVAIMGASVNNNSQQFKTYYNPKHSKFYSYLEIGNLLIKNEKVNIENKTEEEQHKIVTSYIKDILIEKGTLVYSSTVDKEIVRKKINQQYYENEKDIYSLLYVSSLVIDSPKTMNVIDVKAYTRVIQDKYKRKANFLQYSKRLEDVKEKDYSYLTNSLLDNFGEKVQKELLDTIVKRKKNFNDNANLLQEQLINEKYIKENAEKAWDEIRDRKSVV